MIEQYLIESNPHWQGENFIAGTPREFLPETVSLLDTDHAIAITGVRRCGKSFFLKQLANHLLKKGVPPGQILFLNFEMPAYVGKRAYPVLDELFDLYKKLKNPTGRLYLFFDEIQSLPEWEAWIKYHYELAKGRIKFIITGSNSQLLSTELATMLTGRVIEKMIFPFSFKEKLTHHGITWEKTESRVLLRTEIMAQFDDYLVNGAMPELLDTVSPQFKRELLASYFNAIIYKDIIPRFSVRQAGLLNDLAVYLLSHTSNLVNINKIADYYAANRKTIREFLNFLQIALFIQLIPKYHFSPKTRELSLKKCYVVDNGFAHYLPIQFSPNRGTLLENIVFVELKRRFKDVFYWRNNRECDFIAVDQNGKSYAFQVCFTLTPENRDREIKGLLALLEPPFNCEGTILTYNQTEEIQTTGRKITVVPVFRWLLEKNRNEIQYST